MKGKGVLILVICVVLIVRGGWFGNDDEYEIEEDKFEIVVPVTCGSLIRLKHSPTGFRLHSHDVKYGSDISSKQQSVTGMSRMDDLNSLWRVSWEGCEAGQVIPSGTLLQLIHHLTGRYLTSQSGYKSLISRNQEVAAAEAPSRYTNWKVIVLSKEVPAGYKETIWTQGVSVTLIHKETQRYLLTHNRKYNHPIQGQSEVFAGVKPSSPRDASWVAEEGIYLYEDI